MESEKENINPLSIREKIEKDLEEVKNQLANMEYDLENGRYPGGIPGEYYDKMDELRCEIEKFEYSLDRLNDDEITTPPETTR